MAFLRNQWYAAAWADEVQTEPIGRKILGEDIALYRTASGKAAAIGSVCPHRFAPLEYGVVIGENLKCKYHGLQFGPDGALQCDPRRCQITEHAHDGLSGGRTRIDDLRVDR